MSRPKLQIAVLFQNLGDQCAWYARSPAPPLSGALLAGLTPDLVDIELVHEMVRPLDYDSDADFVALSFMDYCAPHAFEVAAELRRRGKIVVAGGRYATTNPAAVRPHVDAVVVGEAERVWPRVVEDLVRGRVQRIYEAPHGAPLVDMPPPRYDLIEPQFAVPVVTEATRGCPFRCSYCHLTVKPAPYRRRPVEDVIRDLSATAGLPIHKRKLAMLLDNNLGGDMDYAKELLREIAKLDLWALGAQFSFNCLQDDEFVELLVAARGGLAFIGLESLNEPSLAGVHKRQNRVAEYRELFEKLRERGILTFTGMMLGLEGDTTEYYQTLPDKLAEVDPSAILTSIAIPIPGTPFHAQVEADGRIVDRDLSHYDGDHLVFEPKGVGEEEVFEAFARINRTFYAWPAVLARWWRFVRAMRTRGGPLLKALRFAVLSVMYFKLAYFQRHHAHHRVYAAQARRRRSDPAPSMIVDTAGPMGASTAP